MNEPNQNPDQAIRLWNKTAAESLRDNERYSVGRVNGFQIFRQRTPLAEKLLTALLPDPDRLLEGGDLLPGRGNRCRIARVVVAGKSYVLKRYDRRNWVYSFRHVFRKSRALRTWLAAWNFLARGVPVPEPLVCLEERTCRFLGRSYLLSECLEGKKPLSVLWPELTSDHKNILIMQAARVLGSVHRSGCIHGDTNWDNILVRQEGSEFDFSLVDFDCSRIFQRMKPEKSLRDIGHFLRDLDRLESVSDEFRHRFVNLWQKVSGFPGITGA